MSNENIFSIVKVGIIKSKSILESIFLLTERKFHRRNFFPSRWKLEPVNRRFFHWWNWDSIIQEDSRIPILIDRILVDGFFSCRRKFESIDGIFFPVDEIGTPKSTQILETQFHRWKKISDDGIPFSLTDSNFGRQEKTSVHEIFFLLMKWGFQNPLGLWNPNFYDGKKVSIDGLKIPSI